MKDILHILLIAAALGLLFNWSSPHALPLIPREVQKIGTPDSLLFQTPDSVRPARPDSMRVPVIAPLHERALRNPDSMKAVVRAKEEAQVFRIISLEQFKRLRKEHRGILFDARGADDFRKARIPGARNIPGQQSENYFEVVAELPRDTLMIVYCNNPDCHLGRMLAEFLNGLEFRNILLYDEGWDGWIKAKEPVDSSQVRE
jgi:rhodanese-related sulfurtransferase